MREFTTLLFFVIFSVETIHGQASLKGSRESLRKQNAVADREGLARITDSFLLAEMKKDGRLVRLPETVRIDPRLDEEWHWVLPQTAEFLEDLGVEFIDQFGRFSQLNSAVRTIPRQLEIAAGGNLNAAPVEGDRMSPHLTGATVDITKIGMNGEELKWMRRQLLELEALDLIEATEEEVQPVFHVMVFKTYLFRK